MDKGSEKARLSMLQLSVEHVSISYERTLVLKDISALRWRRETISALWGKMALERVA